MSAPQKRKAPVPGPKKATKAATKSKKATPSPKDRFDTDSSDNDSDEELGVSLIHAPSVPKYSEYAKDINKTKLLSSSSGDDASGDENDDNTLNIDEKYAAKFNQRQANRVMSGQVQKFIDKVSKRAMEQEKSQARAEKRLQKKQRKLQLQKMAEELGIEQDTEDEEEAAMLGNGSETESEDEGHYDKGNELNFLSLLQGLKTRDPKIYDKSQVFFDNVVPADDAGNPDSKSSNKPTKEKKMTYQQMMTDAAADGDIDQQDDDIKSKFHYGPLSGAVLTKDELAAQQEKLRSEFLDAVAREEDKIAKLSSASKSSMGDSDDESSESDFDFTPKRSTKATGDDNDDEDRDSDDDFFGKSTIISDPNAVDESSEEEGDKGEDQEVSVRNQANLYSSNKFIHDDLHEAKKVVQRLQKNAGVGQNILSVNVNATGKRSKMSEADRIAADEADKDRFLTKYILGGWWHNQDDEFVQGSSLPLPAPKELFSEHKSMLLQSNLSKNDNDDEDEVIMHANDMYEQQLNFRFDDETSQIKEVGIASFPRAHLVADSLRQDMSKAKAQRIRQKEQQKLELVRQKELVKRLQAEQRKLAQSKIDAIMKVSGLGKALKNQDGSDDDEDKRWSPADLLREFDPAEHDRKTNAIYARDAKTGGDKHDAAFNKVVRGDGFKVSDSDSSGSDSASEGSSGSGSDSDSDSGSDSDSDSDSSDDEDGLSAKKLQQKDKAKLLARLESHKAQQHQEIETRLDKVHAKTSTMRQQLPSLLKEQVRQQLALQKEKQKQSKDKRVTNFSSSDSDSDSDSDSEDDDKITSEVYEAQLPADLKQLDRFEMEEEMLSANLKAQTDRQHKSMVSDLNEIYVDPTREAETWWSQQRQRIIDKPETQARMAQVEGKKAKAEVLAEIIREEFFAHDDDDSDNAVVDLEEEERKMAEMRRTGRGDSLEAVPSKKVAKNPLLGGFRFQYISVPRADFGLSVEDILNTPDQELNKKVSIKKYFPYRDDNADTRHYSELQAEQAQRYKDYVCTQSSKKGAKILTQEEFIAKQEEKAIADNFGGPVRNTKSVAHRHKANWSSGDAQRAREFISKNPQALMQARKDKWMKPKNGDAQGPSQNNNNGKPGFGNKNGKPGFKNDGPNNNRSNFNRDGKPGFSKDGGRPGFNRDGKPGFNQQRSSYNGPRQ